MENALQLMPVIEKLLNYGVATMCTIALLLGLGWHFWKIRPLLDTQNQLIINNTAATLVLSESSKATTHILDRVSDKLIAHDERSLSLMQHCIVLAEGLEYVKENMATMESTVRMHERMDKVADKNDITTVHTRLGKIEENVQEISLQVNKISGKVGC